MTERESPTTVRPRRIPADDAFESAYWRLTTLDTEAALVELSRLSDIMRRGVLYVAMTRARERTTPCP